MYGKYYGTDLNLIIDLKDCGKTYRLQTFINNFNRNKMFRIRTPIWVEKEHF